MWQAFGRGLFPAPQDPGADHRADLNAKSNDPMARLSLAEETAWRVRYRPWADQMSHEVVAATARISRLQLVIDVVVDNNGVRDVERWYRMRHGMAFDYLRGALHRYCEIAGWIEPVAPP